MGRFDLLREHPSAASPDLVKFYGTPQASVVSLARFDFFVGQPLGFGGFNTRDAECSNDIVVQDMRCAGGNGSHREYRITRSTQLAHEHEVERSPQGFRNFDCDGDATSGQC